MALKVRVVMEEWLRGEGSGQSYLLREGDGKKCCIGFLGQALKHPREELVGVREVSTDYYDKWLEALSVDKEDCCYFVDAILEAYVVNDDTMTTDEQKISKLRAIQGDLGVEFEFVQKQKTAPAPA